MCVIMFGAKLLRTLALNKKVWGPLVYRIKRNQSRIDVEGYPSYLQGYCAQKPYGKYIYKGKGRLLFLLYGLMHVLLLFNGVYALHKKWFCLN